MVATVTIEEANGGGDGAPGVYTRVDGQGANGGTDVRFCTMDAFEPDSTNPCIVPNADTNYSYWKHLCLAIAGSFTTINNVRFYTDGTIPWTCGTDGGLFVGVRDSGDNGTPMGTNYELATGVVGTSGDYIDDSANGHAYYKGQTAQPALASDYTSGASLLIDSTDHGSAGKTKAVVLQVKIQTDATQGTQADENLTFLYDEI